MANKNIMGPPYEVPANPEYNTQLESILTSTPVHASVMNPIIQRLLDNTQAVKNIADSKATPDTATGEVNGLLDHLDKQKYDETSRKVTAMAPHYPESGAAGGDLEGTYPAPSVRASAVENKQMTFTQAGARANISSGDTLRTIFGKMMRWFTDLKAVAWSGNYNDLANRPSVFPPAAHRHDDIYYTQAQNNNLLAAKAAAVHGHSYGDISGKPSTFPPAAHTHDDRYYTENESDARYIRQAGGTLTGIVTAQSNGYYETRQVRNIVVSNIAPLGGQNGDIWFRYA